MNKFIRQIKATKEQAKNLESKGYILVYVKMNSDDTNTYNVFEKVDK